MQNLINKLKNKLKNKLLLLLIVAEAVISYAIYKAPFDIAIYYSIEAMFSVGVAWVALKYIQGDSSNVYSVIILGQALLCLLLIPSWSYSVNELLQYKLDAYGATLVQISIALGMASSDRIRIYIVRAATISSCNSDRNV